MSEFFRTTPPGLLTDDDAGFLNANWSAVPPADQPFYAAKLNEWQNFRHHYPRPMTPGEQAAARTEQIRLGEIFTDFDAATQADAPAVLQFADADQVPALKQGLANRAFVSHLTGLDGDKLERDYELARDALAKKLFGGSGVADDATFHAKAAEWVMNENGKEEVTRSLVEAGRRAAAWEGSGLSEAVRPSLVTWQEGQKGKPGYGMDFTGEYERTFKAAQAEAKVEFDRLRPHVDAVWLTLTGGGREDVGEPGAVDFEALADRLMALPPEDRRKTLAMVKARAELLPEKEQAGFWQRAAKSFARQGEAIGQGLLNEAPRILAGIGGEGAEARERQALYEDIRNLQRLDLDPVTGKNWMESAGLAVAGSLPGLATMWTLSPWAMVGQFASDARQTIRSELESKGVVPEMSGEFANGLALPAAVAMSYFEKVTLGMANSIPGVKQLQAKMLTRLSQSGVKQALAVGGAFGLEAVEQNVQEALQDTTPLLLTEMAETLGAPIPEVEAWRPFIETMTSPEAWAVSMVFAGIGFGRMPDLEAAQILRERGAGEAQIEKVLAAQDADAWREAVVEAVARPENAPAGVDLGAEGAGQAVDNAVAGVTSISRDAGGWWVEHADGRRTKTDSVAAAQMLVRDLAQVNTQDEADAMVELADSWAATDPRANQKFTGERVTAGAEGVFTSRDGQAPRLVPMDAASSAELDAEMELLARAEGGAAPVTRIVAGSNSLEYRRGIGNEARAMVDRLNTKQNVGGDVLTQVHERVEATWRAAVETGAINMAETFRAIRRLEAALGRAVLSEDPSEAEVRETVSELVSADVLGRRKDGTRVPAGAISKGLTAAINSAVDPQERAALGKFRSFLRAVRAFWRNVFKMAAAIGKARRDGKLQDGDEWGSFVDKLLGIDAQVAHEADVVKAVEQSAETFSLSTGQGLERLANQIANRAATPQEKARIFNRMAAELAGISRSIQWNDSLSKPSKEKEMRRALVALDAMLMILPSEVRGKIGGFINLATLKTGQARFNFLKDRVEKIDKALERHFRREFTKSMVELIARARPRKGAPGEKPAGKIGAEGHELFKAIEKAMSMDAAQVSAEIARLDTLINSGTLTPEQEAMAQAESNLVQLAGDWKNADAARMSAAVEAAEDVFLVGLGKWQAQIEARRLKREAMRGALMLDTGKLGTPKERQAMARLARTNLGAAGNSFLSLSSFEQVLHAAFGRGSAIAEQMVDAERAAAYQYEDEGQAVSDEVEKFFRSLTKGKPLEAERLRFRMSQPTIDTGNEWGTLSEMQAIQALLMWRQEDGQRHMQAYSIDQAWIDNVQNQLTPEGVAAFQFISDQYADEWQELNTLFQKRHGVNLPRHNNYAPLTVTPQQAPAGQMVSPVTGLPVSGSILTPGSLRTRSSIATAEPDFRDALQTMVAHKRQMAHWKAYYDFAVDAQAVLGNRNLMNSVEAKAGEQAVTLLKKWVDYFGQGGVKDAGQGLAMTQALANASGRFARMALVGRLGTLMIQSTQLGAAVAEMPAGAYALRFSKLMAGRLGWGDAIRSDFIQRRYKQMPPLVQQALEGLKSEEPNAVKHAAQRIGTLISGADALFTAGTYAIVLDWQKKVATDAGLTGADADQAAHRAAERITERVAQPTRGGTRSLFENTATNPMARLSWAFASEARQKLALAAWAAREVKSNPARAARVAFVVWGIGGLMAAVIRNAWRDIRDDEDDEVFDERIWGLPRLTAQTLAGPLQGLPLFGEAMEMAIGKAFGQYVPNSGPFDSLGQSVPAVKRLATLEFLDDEEEIQAVLKDVEAVMTAMGLFNETTASAVAFAHIARDAVALGDAFVTTEEEAEARQAAADRRTIKEFDAKNPKPAKSEEQKAAEKAKRRQREAEKARGIREMEDK